MPQGSVCQLWCRHSKGSLWSSVIRLLWTQQEPPSVCRLNKDNTSRSMASSQTPPYLDWPKKNILWLSFVYRDFGPCSSCSHSLPFYSASLRLHLSESWLQQQLIYCQNFYLLLTLQESDFDCEISHYFLSWPRRNKKQNQARALILICSVKHEKQFCLELDFKQPINIFFFRSTHLFYYVKVSEPPTFIVRDLVFS